MIYFQGTDNTLWKLNPDGTGGAKFFGYKCNSEPVVYGNTIYFQGTDDKLWRIDLDSSNAAVLGGNTTASPPFVVATGVYFRGTDNRLWRIKLDGSGLVNLGNNTTKSTPFVIGQYVFFQGTDDKLWRIPIDGTQGINIGLFQTSSSPFATSRYVFFRGTDDKLWRTNLDGTGGIVLGGGYKTSASPFATDNFVYFRGTDDKLWRTDLDGNGGVNLGGYKCHSSPTVDTSQNFVYFQGTDNALWRINMDGGGGTHLGGFNTASTPFVVQPANQPQSSSFPIPYAVLVLVYSPPGSNGGKNATQVEYSSGSSAGNTVSISTSFKQGYGITATLGVGDGSADFGLSYSDQITNDSSLEIKKTETNDLKVAGPASSDGVDHSKDMIIILLKPTMNVVVDPQYNLNLGLDFAGDNGGVVYLQMDWLQDLNLFAQVQPDIKKRCDNAGIGPADYAQLLALNPFANGPAPIDSTRFQLTNINWPYETADSTVVDTRSVSTNVTYETKNSDQSDWSFSASLMGTIQLTALLKLALKTTATFDWSTTHSSITSNGSSQSAGVTFGGPAAGYAGPSRLFVYLDTMFNTFMFVLSDDQPTTYTGILNDKAGKPIPNTEVKLKIASKVFYTYTNSKGEYRFYHTPRGRGEVSIVPTWVLNTGGGVRPRLNF